MVDFLTKPQRSARMATIRSRGNKDTELVLAQLFRLNAICGWRRYQKLPGTPDFTFRNQRVVVFVDGCFWHACPRHGHIPTGNRSFWRKKLVANKARDQRVTRQLRRQGWRVLRIWEHELAKNPQHCIERIKAIVLGSDEIEKAQYPK